MTHVVEPSRRIGRDAELVAAPAPGQPDDLLRGPAALLAPRTASGTHTPLLVLFDHEEVRQPVRPRRAVHPAAERPRADRPRQRRQPRGLLAGPRPHRRRVRRHGPRDAPELPRPARAAAPDRRRRRTGPQGQHLAPVCDGQPRRGGLHPRLRAGRSADAAVRGPQRPTLRRHRRPDDRRAQTGATTVDFGAPILSMHSSRELCAAVEPARYAAALAAFLAPH